MTPILAFLGTEAGYYTLVALIILAIAGAHFRTWLTRRRRRPEVIDDMLPVVFTYRGKQLTADQVLDELEQAREHDDDTFQWDGLTSELNRMLGRDRG